jgi:hypothetical protein
MLSVFGDESSDETKQRVFAVAGVIGTDAAWDALERKWVARTGGIPFHANNCDSDRGDYTDRPHAENKALYRDLTILLAESGIGGWGQAIDLCALERALPDAQDLAYYRCFVAVLEAMRNCAAANNEAVKFTFDSREESEHNASLLYGLVREDPSWKDYMFSEVSFICARDNPRIQVADLVAREMMKALDNIVGPVRRPPRKSWLALYQTNRFHIDAFSTEWCEDLKRQMPALQAAMGMSREDYITWLTKFRLIDNTTNLFRYLERCDRRDRAKGSEGDHLVP